MLTSSRQSGNINESWRLLSCLCQIDDFLITHEVNISCQVNRESCSAFLKINAASEILNRKAAPPRVQDEG